MSARAGPTRRSRRLSQLAIVLLLCLAPVTTTGVSDMTAGLSWKLLDLSHVDTRAPAYARFKGWVDRAVAGDPGYGFSAGDAAIMFRLDGDHRYCRLAVGTVDQHVTEAEAGIAAGRAPDVARNSYLYAGSAIRPLALTLDACAGMVTPAQRLRWSAYAEQAVWNIWHHTEASWGGKAHPWTGWATDNPGNNYYYSFIEATMYWALASRSDTWMMELRDHLLPPLVSYFGRLAGGGSREGTGYGVAQARLFSLYRLWRDATGEDLANRSPHLSDTVAYWTHATLPTMDRYAPIGDQARYATPDLFDYHRHILLEARQLTRDEGARAMASWWLGNISVPRMTQGFSLVHDLLPAGGAGAPPRQRIHHAAGVGHLFARTGWVRRAMWVSFVAGNYDESHAHQDQGAFTLFAGDWLAVTANIWSRSGINQGPRVHNVVRFESDAPLGRQCQPPRGERVVHQCRPSRSRLEWVPRGTEGGFVATADLTPAYGGSDAVRAWRRRLEFRERRLLIRDSFQLGAGTRAVFQVNVPQRPRIDGREALAGRLRIRVLEPAGARLSVHDWARAEGGQFHGGWRVDVTGGDTGYLVELVEQ